MEKRYNKNTNYKKGRGGYNNNNKNRNPGEERGRARTDAGKKFDKPQESRQRERSSEVKVAKSGLEAYRVNYELLVSLISTSFDKTAKTLDFLTNLQGLMGAKICVLVDSKDTQLASQIQSKYSYLSNVIVIKVEPKDGLANHNKSFFSVLGAGYILTMDDNVQIREFAIEKMIKFIYDKDEVAAMNPKFYDTNGDALKLCKRFPGLFDLFFKCFLPKTGGFKKRILAHTMEEGGDSAYHTIHRVDHPSSRFLLTKGQMFYKLQGFKSGLSSDTLTELDFGKRILRNQSKVLFYPFSRVVTSNSKFRYVQNSGFANKLKYFMCNGVGIW
jgi:hypothetical protein